MADALIATAATMTAAAAVGHVTFARLTMLHWPITKAGIAATAGFVAAAEAAAVAEGMVALADATAGFQGVTAMLHGTMADAVTATAGVMTPAAAGAGAEAMTENHVMSHVSRLSIGDPTAEMRESVISATTNKTV
jgi:hypothetical protein